MSDFLTKDVSALSCYNTEKQQWIKAIKHENRDAEMKVNDAMGAVRRQARGGGHQEEHAKQAFLEAANRSKEYESATTRMTRIVSETASLELDRL